MTAEDLDELSRLVLLRMDTSKAVITLQENKEALDLLSAEERELIEAKRRGPAALLEQVQGALEAEAPDVVEHMRRLREHLRMTSDASGIQKRPGGAAGASPSVQGAVDDTADSDLRPPTVIGGPTEERAMTDEAAVARAQRVILGGDPALARWAIVTLRAAIRERRRPY